VKKAYLLVRRASDGVMPKWRRNVRLIGQIPEPDLECDGADRPTMMARIGEHS